ncbi:MAG: DinB family protein [Chitinophagales bacterium]
MQTINTLIENIETARKRSLLVFRAIPHEHIHWKLDEDSMSLIETVRHVLDCDKWYHKNIADRSNINLNYDIMFGGRPYISIENEIEINQKDRIDFIEFLKNISDDELQNTKLQRRSGTKRLDTFLLEIAYHEAYHTAQIQLYLRLLKTPRADIW